MTTGDLAAYLAVLREAGVAKGAVRCDAFTVEVEFAPVEPPPGAPLVDEHGKPVDLDDGMPDLAKDPIAERNWQPKAQ